MIDWIKKLIIRYRRFITYAIMGAVNTLLDYAVFSLAYYALNVPAFYSQAIGFICGSVCGYILNSRFTFKEGRGRTKAQFVQYIGLDIVLTLISSGVMHWTEGAGINVYLTKIIITGLVTIIHYTVYKYVVFRIKKEDRTDE